MLWPWVGATVIEESMVPSPSLTIRELAIAACPTAWEGQNQRDILVSLGFDVDKPGRDLPQKDQDRILFTQEQSQVPVHPGFPPAETRRAVGCKEEPGYIGMFASAMRHVFSTLANTHSAMMKKRVSEFMIPLNAARGMASAGKEVHQSSVPAVSAYGLRSNPYLEACDSVRAISPAISLTTQI